VQAHCAFHRAGQASLAESSAESHASPPATCLPASVHHPVRKLEDLDQPILPISAIEIKRASRLRIRTLVNQFNISSDSNQTRRLSLRDAGGLF